MSTVHRPESPVKFAPIRDEPGPSRADLEWDQLCSRAAAEATADLPGAPLLPFADWIEAQAATIRRDGTAAARWLAGRLDGLAALARSLQADEPAVFDAREELQDFWRDEALRAAGAATARRERTD
jgi:hypothetical protein